MSEKNKALVRDVFKRAWDGDLSEFRKHPGLSELLPMVEAFTTVADDATNTMYEVLADGDWVAYRFTTDMTLNQEFMGIAAGTHIVTEAIGTCRIVNGTIVEQHSQGSRIDVPFSL